MAKVIRKQLGQMLLQEKLITEDQLNKALEMQKGSNELIGKILVKMGFVTEEAVTEVFARQKGLDYVNLKQTTVDQEAVQIINKETASKYKVFPYKREKEKLYVAMENPFNVFVLDELNAQTGYIIEPVVASERDIQEAIERHYRMEGSLTDAITELAMDADIAVEEVSEEEKEELDLSVEEGIEDAPIIRLVNAIILQAIRERASDIHIEPQVRDVRVRYRIDGVLHEVMRPPKRLQNAIISRIKVMANMDIAERRLPQDGRIMFKVEGKDYDFRISSVPAMHGEKLSIRILDKSGIFLTINKLGFSSEAQKVFEDLIEKPYGMIVVTGPTGCGKTTTLYSAIRKLNTLERNLITIEDPIEYQLDGIAQAQVNVKAGLTFASALRSILRQDPDIVMVGEIRDRETAEISIHAALTGHLVLSTMHTNDAALTVVRFFHMGIEPFLISSSMIGIVSQRLARTICPHCKEPYETSSETLRRLGLELSGQSITLYQGQGCDRCHYSGFYGRTGIFEIMPLNDEIRQLIVDQRSAAEIREAAKRNGMKTLIEDALEKVLEGVTTVEEAIRCVFVR